MKVGKIESHDCRIHTSMSICNKLGKAIQWSLPTKEKNGHGFFVPWRVGSATCPLFRGCPLFGGSTIRGSAVVPCFEHG